MKKTDVAAEFDVQPYNVSKILKERNKYLQQFATSIDMNRKSTKVSSFPDLDKNMVGWIKGMTDKGAVVTRQEMQMRGLLFAKELNLTTFKATDGWITKMCKRQGIGVIKIHGDAGSVSEVTVAEWKQKLPSLMSGYEPENVFNMDETGLF